MTFERVLALIAGSVGVVTTAIEAWVLVQYVRKIRPGRWVILWQSMTALIMLIFAGGFLLLADGEIPTARVTVRVFRPLIPVLFWVVAIRGYELYLYVRMQDQFVSNVSHELRTPLGKIFGYAEFILDSHDDLPDELRKQLEVIHRAAGVMRFLVENVLTVFKDKHHTGFEGEHVPVDLSEVVRSQAESMRLFAEQKGIGFLVLVEDGVVISGNEIELRLMLNNLIDNAIKFTKRGGVEVHLDRREGTAVLQVRDTGIGIPPNVERVMWEPFRQGDMGDRRKWGGSGIGLHVVRLLVEKHRGHIEVESAPGKGSVFVVRFL